MTKKKILSYLDSRQYYLVLCTDGTYFASKNNRTYSAKSLNGLYNQITKPLYNN